MFQLYAAPQHIVAMLTCIYAFVLQAAKQQQPDIDKSVPIQVERWLGSSHRIMKA